MSISSYCLSQEINAKMMRCANFVFRVAKIDRSVMEKLRREKEKKRFESIVVSKDYPSKEAHAIAYDPKGVEKLDLRFRHDLTDLSPLTVLENLKFIDLSFCKKLSDIEVLGDMKKLLEVYLSDTNVKDLSALSNIGDSLKRLFLNKVPVVDFSPLSDLKNIRLLWLGRTNFSNFDLVYLKDLPNLTILWLNKTKVNDLSLLNEFACFERGNKMFLTVDKDLDLSPIQHLIDVNLVGISYGLD